jgi:hypothetical protein
VVHVILRVHNEFLHRHGCLIDVRVEREACAVGAALCNNTWRLACERSFADPSFRKLRARSRNAEASVGSGAMRVSLA